VRGSGLNHVGGRPLVARPDFQYELARAVRRGVRGAGRAQVVDGRSWRRLDRTRARRPRSLQAADLAVAQTVVAEGEHAPGECDLGDVAAAAFGDPLEGGAQRTSTLGRLVRSLDQRPADVGGALPGDVAEPRLAIGERTVGVRPAQAQR
jgi:hypothetical protein